jgi:hypothetical protein
MSVQRKHVLAIFSCLLLGCGRNAAQGGGGGGPGGGGPNVNSGGGVIACSKAGETQSCCTTGTMTCSGDAEFPTFGPCLSPSGMVLSCCIPAELQTCNPDGGTSSSSPGGCMPSEFTTCDAGAPAPALCTNMSVNTEPKILVGYAPASGQAVGAGGQIKVWVNDEGAPIIAPGEQVDPNTGAITMPGDRTAKAADGYLWEPALYIAPQSAENGGTPHFPTAIKGSYNNTTVKGPGMMVAGMDPPPAGSTLGSTYTGEDIWDVSSLGLGPGVYTAEFVIHDGDRDRAVGCVTIQIQ